MTRSRCKSPEQKSSVDEESSGLCSRCKTSLPVGLDYVAFWLEKAEIDAKEANRSKSKTHALFWLQQSAEKLVKARLLAYGWCYCAVVEVGHESLKGFLKVIGEALQDSQMRSRIDTLTESNSQQMLDRVQRVLGDAEWRSVMMLCSPEELKVLLDLVTKLRKERIDLLSEASRYGFFRSQSRFHLYDRLWQAISARLKRQGADVEEVMSRIYSVLGVCKHQSIGQGLSIDIKNIENRLQWAEDDIFLYVLAGVTFPHAISSRYPAHPDAPDDLQEAATFKVANSGKNRRKGGMGIQHYSNRLGVIYYVNHLAKEAEATAISMQERWRSLKSDDLDLLPPCEKCENTTQS